MKKKNAPYQGAKPVGSFSSIEAIRSPGASRGRWARSSRAPAEAKEELDDEVVELKEMMANMKLEKAKLKYQYELALEEFDRQKRRAYIRGGYTPKGVEAEYMRSWNAYSVVEDKACALEFKINSCLKSHSSQTCRTAGSEASEDPEDFHRRPSSV